MTNDKRVSLWLIKWIAASTLSWMSAILFGVLCRDLARHTLNINSNLSTTIMIVAALFFGGVLTSLTQWRILSSATDKASQWGKASIKGWAAGAVAGILIFTIAKYLSALIIALIIPGSVEESFNWGRAIVFAFVALPIAGVVGWLSIHYVVGMFQSKILNQSTQQNSHWVKTSLFGGIIAVFVVICTVMVISRMGSSQIAILGTLGAIYGMITGVVTGTRLAELLFSETKKEEVANT